MDISSLIRMRNSLKRVMDTLERINEVTDKELFESVENWTINS